MDVSAPCVVLCVLFVVVVRDMSRYANTPQKFTNYVHDFSGILDFSF